jgi:small redox-active disulfide protein 2
MSEVVQIRVGRHLTGIIGLNEALDEAVGVCRGQGDKQVGAVLLDLLSRRNYIPSVAKDLYVEAFVREYKKHVGLPVAEKAPEGLQVKVLGRGCPQCERLAQEVMEVMAETGISGDLEHVKNLAEIGRYGVMGAPALVIDGEVKAVGSVPPKSKIKAWIEQAASKTK